jgi:hypothetical protein
MYLERGRRFTPTEFQKAFNLFCSQSGEVSPTATKANIESAAEQLRLINDALLDGASVFAVPTKIPTALDRGVHEFRLYWVSKQRQLEVFIVAPALFYVFGMRTGGVFRSNSLAQARHIDATRKVFTVLRKITGTYAHIDVA